MKIVVQNNEKKPVVTYPHLKVHSRDKNYVALFTASNSFVVLKSGAGMVLQPYDRSYWETFPGTVTLSND